MQKNESLCYLTLVILNIPTIGIKPLVLIKRSLKVLKAKDHDSQKGGTKVEQESFSCMERTNEVT